MKTVLITGAARRGGAAIAQHVHQRGYRVILHCRETSLNETQELAAKLNAERPASAEVWSVQLDEHIPAPPFLSGICGIVCCASSYTQSSLRNALESFDADMQTHTKGHLALIRHCQEALAANRGAIVAITDIHVNQPHRHYLSYQVSKSALSGMVRALALELAPAVRVNEVAPGTLEWPATEPVSAERKLRIVETTPLGRTGTFEELAKAVGFLLFEATFTTGTVLKVDGGRSIFLE